MHVITRSHVLFLWIQTVVFVCSQDCTLQDFLTGPLFDPNFDTTSLDDTYPNGQQVKVSCNVGYSGSLKSICVEGEWYSRGTKCQPFQCPIINVPDNLLVTGDPQDSSYGNVLRFSCKFNHQFLDGEQEIYCDENAKWSADPPTCTEVICPAREIGNGTITGEVRDYKEGEVLHFKCQRGFKKQSGIPSKCSKRTNSAEFIPPPVCEESKCTLPLSISQGSSYDPPGKNVFRPNQTVTVNCDRRHYIITPQTTSQVCTCDENGNWDITPECLEVRCWEPDRFSSVRSFGPPRRWGEQRIFTMDNTAEYECQRGFRKAAIMATCTRDGWAPDPLCEATSAPAAPDDGDQQ